jgi:hypothetical protein
MSMSYNNLGDTDIKVSEDLSWVHDLGHAKHRG